MEEMKAFYAAMVPLVAEGEFRKSTSDAEEIVPGWYTREEIKKLLRTEAFAARTQAYCYAWANS